MSVFPNGKYFWFDFRFNGVRHRQSTKSENKQVAERIEAEYRRNLELGQVGLKPLKQKQTMFGAELKAYIELMQPHWKPKTRIMHYTSFPKVMDYFGKKVLNEITADTLSRYIVYRQNQLTIVGTPPSNRTINTEITLVRQLLVKHKLWGNLREGTSFRMLKENDDTGKALTEAELHALLQACRQSSSRVLYTAVLLSIFTGLRSLELKSLRWNQIDLLKECLIVGKSKSKAGEGRVIHLSVQAVELIKNWRSNFAALPEHFVFPSERYGYNGKKHGIYLTDPNSHYQTFQKAWSAARQVAGVDCRWHDLRHTCVSIVADGGASDATMREWFGWGKGVEKMIRRYSHSREQARKTATVHLNGIMENILNQQSEGKLVQ